MSLLRNITAVLLLAALWPRAASPADGRLAITHVTVIDTTGGPPQADRTVLLAAGHIFSVGPARGTTIPQDARVIDATGKFLIPGLWDMHVHLAQAESDKWTRTIILPLLVANGITGVRDMGGDWRLLQVLRRDIQDGKMLGPQIVAAGPAFDGPPSQSSPEIISLANAAEARAAVLAQQQRGVDFIKVLSLVPRDAYFAVAQQSRKWKLPFAGHVPEAVSVVEASQAGQKSVEHLTGFFLACSSRETKLRNDVLAGIRRGKPFVLERIANHLPPRGAVESFDAAKCSRVFAELAKNRTWQDPTLVSQRAFSIIAEKHSLDDPSMKFIPMGLQAAGEEVDFKKLEPQDSKDLAQYFEKSTPLVRGLRRAGIPFLAGTDAPYPPQAGFSLHQELSLLVQAGLTPLEALQAATLNPAKFFGQARVMGSIAPGKIADLLLLDANPLEDISNTQKIRAVVLRGTYLSRRDLDAILSRVESAATAR